ncbi:hypothetical protein PoB_001224300 [Plakobranchus ocellatus]|uniref:Uncharacterized protein n=1 Tax=Plakobranchus ocellatus TaxID=259542 RepID=A0AAV3YTN6_9GAST|nr:hypothetical protein PoB_001224300 [Plakobranchus ocellatus]
MVGRPKHTISSQRIRHKPRQDSFTTPQQERQNRSAPPAAKTPPIRSPVRPVPPRGPNHQSQHTHQIFNSTQLT